MLDLLVPPRRASHTDDWAMSTIKANRSTSTKAGVLVDNELAMNISAAWSATRLLSESTGGLPIHCFRRLSNGDREQAPTHRHARLIRVGENMLSPTMREGRTMHQVNWGDGFAELEHEVITDPESDIIGVWPIHPYRVREALPGDHFEDGRAVPEDYYLVRNNDGRYVALAPWQMLHVPGALSEDGIWGKGVLDHARETAGVSLATEMHGAVQFGGGNLPRVVVHGPGMKNPEDRKNFRDEWKEIHGSPDACDVAILPTESTITPLTMTNENMQFLGLREYTVGEWARWYRIPVYMLEAYIGKAASYNSVEMRGIEFVIYSLYPWPRRWEEQLNLKLLRPDERADFYFEHSFAGLLRGDIKSRMEAYKAAILIGVMTINECRRLENLPGIGEAGDVNYVPLNMTTAELAMLGPPEKAMPSSGGDPFGEPDDTPEKEQAAFDRWSRGRVKRIARREVAGLLKGMVQDARSKNGVNDACETRTDRSAASQDPGDDVAVAPKSSEATSVGDVAQVLREDGGSGAATAQANSDGKGVTDVGPAIPTPAGRDREDDRRDTVVGDRHDIVPDGAARSGSDSPSIPESAREAARTVLTAALARRFTKEANAIRRGVNRPDFLEWMERYYEEKAAALAAELPPVVAALTAAGFVADVDGLSKQLTVASVVELREAYNTETKEQFLARLAAWPTKRAEKVAQDILERW